MKLLILSTFLLLWGLGSRAETTLPSTPDGRDRSATALTLQTEAVIPDTLCIEGILEDGPQLARITNNIYAYPYSFTASHHDWKHLWINTAVLTGAFTGTLLVLECLPEDATSWNRAALQEVPLGKRWRQHVIEKGPEWDHDKFVFNYVLHPYAGAVYYMSARSCGFNAWQSFLYCTLISNLGWEYGIEAFMERPSIQDLLITPIIGSAIGEGFYKIKRHIVCNDYRLWGSKILGNIVAFLVDPVNEVVDLFRGSPTRGLYKSKTRIEMESSLMPDLYRKGVRMSVSLTF